MIDAILYRPNIYINSYYSLDSTWYGKKALSKFLDLHALEDGSIRREPDFKNHFPGVSGICRPGAMTNINLKEGDIIIYKTNELHYLTAILKVKKKLIDHQDAKRWYEINNLPIPSNCIFTKHLSIERSHAREFLLKVDKSKSIDKNIENQWDEAYKTRALNNKSSYFYITEPIYNAVKLNLQSSDFIILDKILKANSINNKIHNTSIKPQPLSLKCYMLILNKIFKNNFRF
ncbi:MAG: hypothetical protein SFY32_13045 [Bacteroidota bacterium]|nr:hypothetical protein [Bacteroidota bacterium]